MIPDALTLPPAEAPSPHWHQDLAVGAPGIVLLHAERARVTGDDHTLHRWVSAMMASPLHAHQRTGLYQGAPAAVHALHAATCPGQPTHQAYTTASAALEHQVAQLIRDRLAQADDRLARGELPTFREFDLISGLTGLGVLLVHHPRHDDLLRAILTYLVRLTHPITIDGQAYPGWWSSTAPNAQPSPRWPHGHGNLGMAHGISGPLALLAICHRRGTTVPGHLDAIGRILGWLDDHRITTDTGTSWPGPIPHPRLTDLADLRPERPSWCYGTPGIARAQQLAALACGDDARHRAATKAVVAVLRDPGQLDQLPDSSLCHGWAGLLLTTWRMAADAPSDEGLDVLMHRLRNDVARYLRRNPMPDGGLLEGTAGMSLALHTTRLNSPPLTGWDRCLLIAE